MNSTLLICTLKKPWSDFYISSHVMRPRVHEAPKVVKVVNITIRRALLQGGERSSQNNETGNVLLVNS
jgi:hypothetical protein